MVDSLKVYDLLKDAQIPEPQARAITRALQDSDREVERAIGVTLDERFRALEDRLDLRLERFATKDDLAELKVDMAGLRSELIRWMFLFWVGQMAATLGMVKFMR